MTSTTVRCDHRGCTSSGTGPTLTSVRATLRRQGWKAGASTTWCTNHVQCPTDHRRRHPMEP